MPARNSIALTLTLTRWVLVGTVAATAQVGCASGPAPEQGPAPKMRVQGIYGSRTSGSILAIYFRDSTRYRLWKDTPCAEQDTDACAESGHYELGDDTITLTDEQTGLKTTLPFKVTDSKTPDTNAQSLRIQAALVSDDGQAEVLVGTSAELVTSANVGDTGVTLLASGDPDCNSYRGGRDQADFMDLGRAGLGFHCADRSTIPSGPPLMVFRPFRV